MTRWRPPHVWLRLRRQSAVLALLVVVAGAIALLWGGARLQKIFVEERDSARQAVDARRRAIEKYARVALERKLRTVLAEARPRIDAALDNPLQSDPGLLAIDQGRQRLPRLLRFVDGSDAPARRLYEQLADGAPPSHDGIRGERVALLAELRRATEHGDDAATTKAVRDFLNHQSRYVIPVTQDLPVTIAFLETLVQGSTPARQLMQALLRDGLRGARGRKLVALQASLLEHRERFTRPDFTFLAQKLTLLSGDARVVHDDFEAQLFSGPERTVAFPDRLDAPALIEGTWFVAPLERDAFRGVAVDLNELLEEIATEMRSGGLLGSEDVLSTADSIGPLVAVADLPAMPVALAVASVAASAFAASLIPAASVCEPASALATAVIAPELSIVSAPLAAVVPVTRRSKNPSRDNSIENRLTVDSASPSAMMPTAVASAETPASALASLSSNFFLMSGLCSSSSSSLGFTETEVSIPAATAVATAVISPPDPISRLSSPPPRLTPVAVASASALTLAEAAPEIATARAFSPLTALATAVSLPVIAIVSVPAGAVDVVVLE
jgi:hypothetical protein